VQRALAHVRIDHQHLLSRLGDHRGQVGRDEGLAHAGARTGDHQDVVLGFQHGEMQAGAQAADRFHRRVGRCIDRQQVRAALHAVASAPPAPMALATLLHVLGRAQRNDRIHRQAQLLDLRRVLHARVHDPAQEHHTHRQEAAQQGADQHHQ